MKALDFPLLADENIDPDVVAELRARGYDVASVRDRLLGGRPDAEILATAVAEGRVVLTHDADFGLLAIRRAQPCVGIVYLRPGHIAAAFVLEMIDALIEMAIEAQPPFLVVAVRKGNAVTVRLRAAKLLEM